MTNIEEEENMLKALIAIFLILAILSLVLDLIFALLPIVIVGAIIIYLYNRFAGGGNA